MAEEIKFKQVVYADSTNALNEYADRFAYSSFGEPGNRFGSIAFFKHVSDWVSENEVQPTRYQIANIRMSENSLVELARFIIQQHEQAEKDKE